MGKHTIKQRIWNKISKQNKHGFFPEWVGWVVIGGIIIWFLFTLL
jgi:hypothetical protein